MIDYEILEKQIALLKETPSDIIREKGDRDYYVDIEMQTDETGYLVLSFLQEKGYKITESKQINFFESIFSMKKENNFFSSTADAFLKVYINKKVGCTSIYPDVF